MLVRSSALPPFRGRSANSIVDSLASLEMRCGPPKDISLSVQKGKWRKHLQEHDVCVVATSLQLLAKMDFQTVHKLSWQVV